MKMEELASHPRVVVRRSGSFDGEGRAVVYWMQRSQRGVANPALEVAIEAANELRLPVAVFFGLHPGYPNANLRHYAFLLEGLEETIRAVEGRGAAFVFRPYPDHDLLRFCEQVRPALVIGDENPLRLPESWRRSAARKLKAPFWTVDADTVVPVKFFTKDEYAARTLRPKLMRLLEVFLQPIEDSWARYRWDANKRPLSVILDNAKLLASLPINRSALPLRRSRGGTREAMSRLRKFLKDRLASYNEARNLPEVEGTSELSAYLHFGHISPLTIALAVRDAEAPPAAKAAYLEELIVRRELAINFVKRNPDYDRLEGCSEWARATLAQHRQDPRPHHYSTRQFEAADTHDDFWNAAQLEMVTTGRMHGYMRMYWAKKILEWTRSPEEAFEVSIELNDRYSLDGRDPSGYAGIAWAVAGKHDRPWGPRRPVFGTVRYMSRAGMSRKFDVDRYVSRVRSMT